MGNPCPYFPALQTGISHGSLARLSETSIDITAAGNDKPRWRIPPWSWPILVSALAWAIIIIAIPPARQDFPLGDDWAFARGAIWFARGEGIHYSKWASMPQLGQWLWSWPFLQAISPPHFALRFSVIALSWLGLVAFYDLLRQKNIPAELAGFAACVLATNPLFFVSQGTYMTDVPALSFGVMALNCYSRAMIRGNLRWLAGAVVLAVLGAITRQTMIAAPLAALLVLVKSPKLRLKLFWALAAVIPVVACVSVGQWFAHRPDILPMHLALKLEALVVRPLIILHLCGLAVLPLCLLTWRRRSWKIFAAAFTLMLLAVGFLHFFVRGLPYGGSFPYCPGMLSPWGTFSSGLVAGEREILLTRPLRLAITVLGCIGGAEILVALAGAVRAGKYPGFLMLFTALELLALLALPDFMDRYVEVLFPGVVYLVVTQSSMSDCAWLPGTLMVALCGLISVGLFHDWLSWNTARWELGRRAIAAKVIQPNDIEGGFEWNGWYASADPGHSLVASGPLNTQPGLSLRFSRYFFPQVNGQYALSFTPLEKSKVVDSIPYTLWLPPRQTNFLFVAYTGQ